MSLNCSPKESLSYYRPSIGAVVSLSKKYLQLYKSLLFALTFPFVCVLFCRKLN